MNWFQPVQDTARQQALVNTVMNFGDPQKTRWTVLTSQGLSFTEITCCHVENVDKRCKNKLYRLCKERRTAVKAGVVCNRTGAFRKEVSHEDSHRSDKTCVWHLSS
jgi:hypothetical protein